MHLVESRRYSWSNVPQAFQTVNYLSLVKYSLRSTLGATSNIGIPSLFGLPAGGFTSFALIHTDVKDLWYLVRQAALAQLLQRLPQLRMHP